MPNPSQPVPDPALPLPPSRGPAERRSGTLHLFQSDVATEAEGTAPSGLHGAPFARLRLCRGFLDDLNRILPIRARIRLEGELAQGLVRGEMDAPIRFRWEFTERGVLGGR